jgi:transposase
MTDHTPIPRISRLDVIATGARRRWTLEEKRRIVAESYDAPRLVSATARRNGLSASQLFTWRRLAREGQLVEADEAITFAPAIIKSSTGNPPSLPGYVEAVRDSPSLPCALAAPSRIEIVLMGGHRVIVDNGVAATVLARVIAALERP